MLIHGVLIFALLDSSSELAGLPYCYRDFRSVKAVKELLSVIAPEKVYMKTGYTVYAYKSAISTLCIG